MKILSKLIFDHRCDWLDFVPKAVLSYNTSVHESTLLTPYRLMFGREAILPSDAILRIETAPPQGSVQKYPKYVVLQKQQLKETEQLARQNLKPVQKFQKAYYKQVPWSKVPCRRQSVVYKQSHDEKKEISQALVWSLEGCEGPVWCYSLHWGGEEEARKMSLAEGGPPQLFETMLYATWNSRETLKEATATHVEETPPVETLRAVQQPSQGTSADSGDVELEWLENPATTGRELSLPPHDREESGALSSSVSATVFSSK